MGIGEGQATGGSQRADGQAVTRVRTLVWHSGSLRGAEAPTQVSPNNQLHTATYHAKEEGELTLCNARGPAQLSCWFWAVRAPRAPRVRPKGARYGLQHRYVALSSAGWAWHVVSTRFVSPLGRGSVASSGQGLELVLLAVMRSHSFQTTRQSFDLVQPSLQNHRCSHTTTNTPK